MVLNFFEDPGLLNAWRKYGGLEFLHSYGVDVSDIMRGQGYEKARDALNEKMPPHHREFLEQTRHFVTYGDYFFCHAGIRPGVPCENQSPSDLLWIREDFLRFEGKSDKVVVHGHTPVARPEIRHNRINVDTGAFATSVLTAVVLEHAERRFLSVGAAA
jgi:serine/threonine protein phosphatase 1